MNAKPKADMNKLIDNMTLAGKPQTGHPPKVGEHQSCRHEGQPTWDLIDAQGIYCARVCAKCEDAKRATYRPEIFSGYSQADVDEPIEPEPGYAPGSGAYNDMMFGDLPDW